MKMLCVFIDALNPEYLKYMPFLNSARKECLHGSLEVPLGYTSIIASFMTGLWQDKHKVFDLFTYDEKERGKLDGKYFLALKNILKNRRFFYTPLKEKRRYFKPSLEKAWAQKNSLPSQTVFDVLEKEGRSFEVIDWPNHFKGRKGKIFFSNSWKKVLKLAKKSRADFVFIHFLDLEIAHKYGIESRKTIETAKRIDEACEQLYNKSENVLFFSDHGMDDIEKEFDIITELKNLNLKFGKDFVYLAGSTTAEFWFKNKKAESAVIKLLKKLKCGKIVDKKSFHIKTSSDLIFLANFKTAFYPNFFSKKRFKAMHGWNPKKQKTFYILKNNKKLGRKNARMIDFLPTILKLMHLKEAKCDGKSLV